MSEFAAIERFIETEGVDKGRIKDIDIAFELAHIEYAWREEGDGRAILEPPERLGKSETHFNTLMAGKLKQLIVAKVLSEIDAGIEAIHESLPPREDLEDSDESWFSYRIASILFGL